MHALQGDVFGALSEAFRGPKQDFRRQNNKNEVQRSPQTTKAEHFRRPPLRKWWPFCLLRTRFTSMFELCTPAFYVLGVSFYLFRSASTQSFLLCRRNLRGFGSCTGGKPQVSGVFQRQNRRKRALKSTMAAL